MAEDAKPRSAPAVATWGKTSISAGVRYATDAYGVAIGGGAGYTLSPGIYLGNQADFYFGDGAFTGWSVLLEAGYDFGLGESFVFRPVLGAGAKQLTYKQQCEGDACIHTSFAFGIGLQAYWYMLSWLNLGIDARSVFSNGRFFVFGLHVGVSY
jgi:hypothetical protein